MKKMSRRIITYNETLRKINTSKTKGHYREMAWIPFQKDYPKLHNLTCIHDLIRLKLRKLSWVNFRINNFWIKFLYNFFT